MMARATSKALVDQLIQNNIALQKKSAELLVSMNQISKKLDKMLSLFEGAAKEIKKGEVEEPLAKKLSDLLEQNKQIARGLILLERYVREKSAFTPISSRPELQKSEF